MKTALIDHISPIGHISLINFYIKNLHTKFDFIFLNKSIENKTVRKKNIKFISFNKFFFFKLIKLFLLFHKMKKAKVTKIILLSYEPKLLFILSKIINLNYFNLYLVEHDTLNTKKYFNLFLIKYLPKKIIHLTYSLPAKKYLKKKLHRMTLLINHPIIKNDKISNYLFKKHKSFFKGKNTILIPTRHHFKELSILKVLNTYQNINFIILLKNSNLKKKKFFNYRNTLTLDYISENYISKIDAIYLPIDDNIYKYRISAWLYRGIAFEKIVILNNNFLFRFEKKRFPNYILNSKLDFNKICTLHINKKKHQTFVKKYNISLLNNFKKILIN